MRSNVKKLVGIGRTHFFTITSAIPPSMAVDVSSKRNVIGSARKITPPTAAITGTDNCTLAADVFLSAGKTVYQMA